MYALTPVDLIVMRYNVSRILAGDPAPSVQISVHPIDAEGLRELLPLLESRDELIREGVKSLLARIETEMWGSDQQSGRGHSDWGDLTALQLATEMLWNELKDEQDRLQPYVGNIGEPQEAWDRFQKYAYQWY
jgi:hypothetical protein